MKVLYKIQGSGSWTPTHPPPMFRTFSDDRRKFPSYGSVTLTRHTLYT